MGSMAVAGIVFVCVFGGALLGMFLSSVLPKHHLSQDSKDVVKLTTAVLGTMAALVVGLLISSAKSSFDTKDSEVKHIAAQIVQFDQTLADYGPETQNARKFTRDLVAARVRDIWNENSNVDTAAIRQVSGSFSEIQRKVLALSPANDTQRWLQSKALQIIGDLADTRWLLTQQTGGTIQWQFLAILVFWLTVIFGSFGMFAPRNGTVIGALFVGALSMAGSIYLITEMDQPFTGFIKISSAPMHFALEQLDK
jgi:hypothetical protein